MAGRRILLAAFGDPGHAFPIIGLAETLIERGNQVAVETAEVWRSHVQACGAQFLAAPEYPLIPTRTRPLEPYEAARQATLDSRSGFERFGPDVIVHDVLTLAPALVAEQLGVKVATFIPHVYPTTAPPVPPYGFGARPPSSALGRGFQRLLEAAVKRGRAIGARDYAQLRRDLGLPKRSSDTGTHSQQLVMVGTFPQLEYERAWPDHIHITGPVFWEPAFGEVSVPPGEAPLVMVAPSTAQDPEHRMLTAAIKGLSNLDIRVIATWNRREVPSALPEVGANTNLVEWLSYSKTMPLCDAVVSHGGHGTVARTLQAGAVPVIVPAAGDQLENAARVDAAGLGVGLPTRLLGMRSLAIAVERALSQESTRRRVSEVSLWSSMNDGSKVAAGLIEGLADQRVP